MGAAAGEQQRIAHLGPRDDAIPRNERGNRHAAPPVFVMHEFGGGDDLGIGPDRPFVVVEVQFRHEIGQVDIGLPEGIDGADVAPVRLGFQPRLDAGFGKAMRHRLAVLDDVGDQVIAEIMAGIGVFGILDQQGAQEIPVEDIDAHRSQGMIRIAGDRGRVFRLFQKGQDAPGLVDIHHAKGGGFHARHGQAADGHIRAGIDMLAQHDLVIHLVDVIARQDHHIFDAVAVDDVDVLRHRIGGAQIPFVLVHPLAGGQDIQVFVAFGAKEAPAALAVADQAVRLVLRGNRHLADAGIQRIRQGEVDDPGLAAEIDRRFGAAIGQFLEAAAPPPRQHEGHGLSGQPGIRSWLHLFLPWNRVFPGLIFPGPTPAGR